MVAGIVLVVILVVILPVITLMLALSTRSQLQELEAKLKNSSLNLARLQDEVRALRSSSGPWGAAQPSETPPESEPEKPEHEEPQKDGEDGAEETPPDKEAPEDHVPASPQLETAAASAPLQVQAEGARKSAGWADLENRIGARWSVILGGLATALGAVLLVRVTIEAGLLGPKVRIALAGLFSLALFAAGEWLRRRDRRFAIPALPKADIPSILTAAGAVGIFATIYGAYALYGFIGPALAFVLLTLAGLVSLALSVVHGPSLAALGVLGSYATPLLVSSQSPNPLFLALHVIVVTAAVCGISVIRNWLWLAYCGVAGGLGWTVLAASIDHEMSGLAGSALLFGNLAIFAAAFGWSKLEAWPGEDRQPDRPALAAFLAVVPAYAVQAVANGLLPEPLVPIVLSLALLGCAVWWPALAPAALMGAGIAVIGQLLLDLDPAFLPGVNSWDELRAGLVPPDIRGYLINTGLLAAPFAIAGIAAVHRLAAAAPKQSGWLAASSSVIAVIAVTVAYMRISPFETSAGFGLAAVGLAFAAALLCEVTARQRPGDNLAPAPTAYAVACVLFLSFAMAVSLEKVWFPIGFAFAALGIAYIHSLRPLRALAPLAIASGIACVVAIFASMPFDAQLIGTTPIFNRLILLVALPALALLAGGELLRRQEAEFAGAFLTSLGLALAGLFAALEIRHFFNGGDITANVIGLGEMAAHAITALAFTIGLQKVAERTRNPVFSNATLVAGGAGGLVIAAGLLVAVNPLFERIPVGETLFFNKLLPAYFIPAILAAAVAYLARPVRPRPYVLGFAALSGLLLFAFVTLSVRHAFQGSVLWQVRPTSDGEYWAYSVAWLLMGIAVLAIGHWLKSLPIRAASGILIALTVCKVFLFDMAALTGAVRAFSFIGLGISLLAIGRFYQFLLRPASTSGEASSEDGKEN